MPTALPHLQMDSFGVVLIRKDMLIKLPPPYGLVQLAIGMKSQEEIAELKNNITNGDEAERLAELWNLEPDSSDVKTMLSNLSRAILNREASEKKRHEDQSSETCDDFDDFLDPAVH